MSNMVVSLLLKVREEGAGALKMLRDGLKGVREEDEAAAKAQAANQFYRMGHSLRESIGAAHELRGALGEVRKATGELMSSFMYGSLGAAGALFGFKEGFLDVAKEVGALRNQLIGLEGSERRGDMALEWIKTFRENTNATLAEVTSAWIELREHGVNPVTGAMQAVADTAAVTGASMEEVSRAIGNAVEGGRAGPLRELGISVRDLGSSMVVTYRKAGQEITETLSKANHSAEKGILRIIGSLHTGAAARAAEGAGGQLKRLGEVWNDFAMQVMGGGAGQGGVMKYLAEQLGQFVKQSKEAGEGGQSFARELADMFKELIRLGLQFMKFTVEYLPAAIRALHDVSGAMGGPKVVAGVLAAVVAGPLVRSLFALGSVLFTTVIPAIWALGVALLTTPVGWIIMGIAALVAAGYELYEHWDQVVAFLKDVWSGFKEFLSDIWEGITSDVRRDVDALVRIFDAIKNSDVAQALIAAWEPVKAFFAGLWSAIKSGYDHSIGPVIAGVEYLAKKMPSFGPGAAGLTPEGQPLPAQPGPKEIQGKAKLDITIKKDGSADAKFSDGGGSLGFDAMLGYGMVL